MATVKKTYSYNVYYDDLSYMTYDFTNDDTECIRRCVRDGVPWAEISSGFLKLKDVRSIVKYKEPPKTEPDKGAVPDYIDMEVQEYLKQAEENKDDSDY